MSAYSHHRVACHRHGCCLAMTGKRAARHSYRNEGAAPKDDRLESFLRDLARTLTLSGDGTRLDRSIRDTISWYVDVQEELRRVSAHPDVPKHVREDVAIGFERMLSRLAELLVRLDVTITPIEIGAKLEDGRFRVVDQLETAQAIQLNTVSECVRPEFTWVNGYGAHRREAAHVRAYTVLNEEKRPARWRPRFK